MRQITISIHAPTIAISLANGVVLITAWFAGWGLGELFRLYWLELVIVGVAALFQIRCARRPGALDKSRGYQGIFFVAHYGTFCIAYGAMLSSILKSRWEVESLYWLVVIIPTAALALAHAVAFRVDFLRRDAAFVSSMQAMLLPYVRVLPVQAPLILVAALLPTDIPATSAAILFALGKTAADVAVHWARRKTALHGLR